MITREEWFIRAVQKIDEQVFNGSLNSGENKFQVSVGRTCSRRANGECILRNDSENATIYDYHPITIHLSVEEESLEKLLTILVHECIHGFFNVSDHGKLFKKHAKEVGLKSPYRCSIADENLESIINNIIKQIEQEYGKYPGVPVKLYIEKEKKERKTKIKTLFCPNCGFEAKANIDMVNEKGLPRCACGSKMGVDDGEENNEQQD